MIRNYSRSYCFLCAMVCLGLKGISQNNNPYTNPVILSHYTVQQLQQIHASDTAKFNAIVYYYTKSFVVEAVACSDCTPQALNTVDVSLYEVHREPHARYERNYIKRGFKLTLLSADELQYPITQ